jgi:hypothetical protein
MKNKLRINTNSLTSLFPEVELISILPRKKKKQLKKDIVKKLINLALEHIKQKEK